MIMTVFNFLVSQTTCFNIIDGSFNHLMQRNNLDILVCSVLFQMVSFD